MNGSDIGALGMEKVSGEHPVHKLAKKAKWLQSASKRMEEKGTKGSLTRIAKSHGESPMGFAHEHYDDSGKLGAKARFAVNANKGK